MTGSQGVLASGRSRALLIGSGSYDPDRQVNGRTVAGWPPVKSARATVERLREVLLDRCGMPERAVTTLHDPADPYTLLSAVDEAARAADRGVLLLYFVGHGAPDGRGRLRLMTRHSAPLYTPGALADYSQTSFENVVDLVHKGKGRPSTLVAFLDCCEADRGAVDIAQLESYFLLAAATKDQRALAPPGQDLTSFGGRVIDLLERGVPEFGPDIVLSHFADVLRETTPEGVPMPKAGGPAGHLVLAPNPNPEALARGKRPAGTRTVPTGRCPYPGLSAFTERDQQWFRGREDEADALVFSLTPADSPRLPVVLNGPSGSGKSSFIQAGLLPRLADRPPEGPASARVTAVLQPRSPHPLRGLAEHLAALAGSTDVADFAARLRGGDDDVRSVARDVMAVQGGVDGSLPELLLIVDQFERNYDPDTDSEERRAFQAALGALARCDVPASWRSLDGSRLRETVRVRVVLSVQSEFSALLAESDDTLRQALTVTQHILPPLGDADVRRAIVEPALMEGIVPDGDFVARVCADFAAAASPPHGDTTADRPPARLLPHLAQALRATWEQSPSTRLTLRAYQAGGGLSGAIQQTADKCYEALDADARHIARVLLLSLVNHSEQRPFDLKTVPRDVLLHDAAGAVDPPDPDRAARTLDALCGHRLVVDAAAGVSLVHLTLLRAWPRMTNWVRNDQEWTVIRSRIQDEARRWDAAGRDRRDLRPNAFLPDDFAEAARRRGKGGLTPRDWAYLDATMTWRGRQARRGRRAALVQRFSAVVAVVTSLACVAGFLYGLGQRASARQARADRTAARLAATADSLRARHPDLAARLAVAAYRASPTPTAWATLLETAAQVRPTAQSNAVTSRLSGSRLAVGDQWIATVTSRGDIALDRVGGGRGSAVLPGSRGFGAEPVFDHHGGLLAGTDGHGVVKIWNTTRPGQAPLSFATTVPGADDSDPSFVLTFSADDALLAIATDRTGQGDGDDPGGSEIWRVSGAAPPTRWAKLPASFARFTGAAGLAVGGPDGVWSLYAVDSSGAPGTLGTAVGGLPFRRTFPAAATCFSPRGDLVARIGEEAGLWELTGRTSRRLARLAGQGASCAFSGDGTLLAVFGTTATEVWTLDAARRPSRAAVIDAPADQNDDLGIGQFSPDGRLLAVPGTPPHLWDVSALRQPGLLARIPATTAGSGPVAVDSAGTTVAVGERDGTVAVWDIRSPRAPRRRPAVSAPAKGLSVGSLAFASGTRRLRVTYTSGRRGTWDLTGPAAVSAPGAADSVAPEPPSVSSPHDHLTATSDGSTVTVTRGAEGHGPTVTLTPDPAADITALALNAEGTLLAAGDERGGVTLVELDAQATPLATAVLPARAGPVTGIALGADDSLLVTAGDGTALLSTLRPVDLIDQVCAAPLSPQVAAAWPRDIPGSAESACPEK
ncbi:nSTAND1 domain-containing NTPase [Streptomyces mirabilis]|uniref:nSTAND1 domain-containing NTPase n=1 Tax=Streptomyces mirabilis TaxID=68239 RepID=UPI0036BA504C